MDDATRNKLEEIYVVLNKAVYRYALKIVKNPTLAEDATQEAFIRLSQNMEKVDEVNDPRTLSFLMAIVRNTSIDALKKFRASSVEDIDDFSESLADTGLSPEDKVLGEDSVERLLNEVGKFGEEAKSLLIYRYVHKFRDKEIAQITGQKSTTITVKMGRIRKRLLKALEQKGGGIDDFGNK